MRRVGFQTRFLGALSIVVLVAGACGPVEDGEANGERLPASYYGLGSYFLGATIAMTPDQAQDALEEVKTPQGLSVVDQYLFTLGERTPAVQRFCKDQKDCYVDTSGADWFIKWLRNRMVVGPNVPVTLGTFATAPYAAACQRMMGGRPCSEARYGDLLDWQARHFADLSRQDQPNAIHEFEKNLMDVMTLQPNVTLTEVFRGPNSNLVIHHGAVVPKELADQLTKLVQCPAGYAPDDECLLVMGAYVVKDSAAKTNYARYFSGEFTIRVTRIVKDANGNPLKDKNGNDKKQILYLNVVQGEIISVSLTYQIVDNCTFMNPYDDKDPTTDDGPVSYEYPKDKALMKFSSFGTKSYLDTSPDPIAISYKAGGVTVVGDVEAYKPLKPMVADSQTPVDCK